MSVKYIMEKVDLLPENKKSLACMIGNLINASVTNTTAAVKLYSNEPYLKCSLEQLIHNDIIIAAKQRLSALPYNTIKGIIIFRRIGDPRLNPSIGTSFVLRDILTDNPQYVTQANFVNLPQVESPEEYEDYGIYELGEGAYAYITLTDVYMVKGEEDNNGEENNEQPNNEPNTDEGETNPSME